MTPAPERPDAGLPSEAERIYALVVEYRKETNPGRVLALSGLIRTNLHALLDVTDAGLREAAEDALSLLSVIDGEDDDDQANIESVRAALRAALSRQAETP